MRKVCIKATLFLLAATACAQEARRQPDNWYFGIGAGFHSTFMKYSDLDENVFPTHKNLNNGVFSVFAQREFGKEHQFAVRPELSFLKRGGRLTEIYSKEGEVQGTDFVSLYEAEGLKDIRYSLKSRYLDIRVPLIYQFGKASSALRPYVFVAPVFGFSLGGGIDLESQSYVFVDGEDGEPVSLGDGVYEYEGTHLNLSKSNMSTFYFAAAVGAGVKWQFNVGRHTCFLGLEAQYEHGFTDTYGDDNSASHKVQLEGLGSRVEGTRRFSGVEVKVMLGIPFSVFKKQQPAPVPVVVPRPEPVPVPEPVEEKPCYSLEEIIDLMARGERVEGKTICAIDDAINFEFGKSTIMPQSYSYLDRLAVTLIRTNARIMVKGHTDNVGSEEFNLTLSKERAMAVVDYLVKKGVSRAKLSYDYYGMSRPLVPNDTEEGRSMNRRVEFEILR